MRSKFAPVAITAAAASLVLVGLAGCSSGGTPASTDGGGEDVTLTLATWRTEDTAMWEDEIIPAFEASHPGITVEYAPVGTDDYNAAMQSQIEGGTGADLIMCRPFDVNRAWIEDGYFEPLAGTDAVKSFDETALAAWTDVDGNPFCVPIASVLAGFYYNTAIFDELGIDVPTTQAEFIDALEKIKASGKYTPLALGSADGWQLAYNVLYNLGPNYWKGEDGRLGLIDGTQKLTDPDFVAAFQAFDDLKPYLPEGYESLTYEDMMQLFTLGKAAIIPDGSWDITAATATGLDVGVFGAPVAKAGDQRYQQEMPDQGIGMNAKSTHKEAAQEFLDWLATDEFQSLYVNKLPGFFAMGTEAVTYDDPLAQKFADLKTDAELTPRLALDRLSAGTPPLDDEIWVALQNMYNSGLSAEDATAELQAGLDSWYKPAQ
ncbi:ABC transporter substrate-binding protein [Herbiconiux sp. UC225_62]|uniref:ABC transporter substrate-binding protein n=1 Tax=Herbiconiux sp. UC225_62 TaxID=3350168 RepID=UPI0036D2178F